MVDRADTPAATPATSALAAVGLASAASAVLLFVALQIGIKDSLLDNGGRQQWWHLAPALLLSAPYLFMVWRAFRGATYNIFVFAQAQAALALVAAIPLSMLAVVGAGLAMGDRDDVNLLYAVLAFAGVQVVLSVFAWRGRRALAAAAPPKDVRTWSALAPLAWGGLAVVGIASAASIGEGVTERAVFDARRARDGVERTAACVIEWRRRHGAYPSRLADLASESCVEQDFTTGRYAGHAISYRQHDTGFVLLAEPETLIGRDKRSPMSDESGRVYTVHDGVGYDGTPYLSASYDSTEQAALLWFVRCLVRHSEARSDGEFPVRLEEVGGCSSVGVEGTVDTIETSHYVLRYRPRLDASGRRTGFDLDVRPRQYGVGAIRSYHADESQIIRGTGENRAATADDPEVFRCELSWGSIEHCDRDFWQLGTSLPALLGRER